MAFSPDGRQLATANEYGTVQLWNRATGRAAGRPIQTGAAIGVAAVEFSSDGRLLATATAGDDGTVQLWNRATGQPVGASIQTGTGTNVEGAAFSSDGRLLATADDDGTVQLWNRATGQPVGGPIQTGNSTNVEELAFSPDGRQLAIMYDGSGYLWNLSVLANPYAALCADVGPPTRQAWDQYAPGEPQPRVCS